MLLNATFAFALPQSAEIQKIKSEWLFQGQPIESQIQIPYRKKTLEVGTVTVEKESGKDTLLALRVKEANSKIDESFGKSGLTTISLGPVSVQNLKVQILDQNKILVGGEAHSLVSTENSYFILRVNGTGELDENFGIQKSFLTDRLTAFRRPHTLRYETSDLASQ